MLVQIDVGSARLVNRHKISVISSQAQLFFTARVTVDKEFHVVQLSIFLNVPLRVFKRDSCKVWAKNALSNFVEPGQSDSYVEALTALESVIIAIKVVSHRQSNVNVFSRDQDVRLLHRVANHQAERDDAQDGAHDGGQSRLPLVQLHLERLAERIVAFQIGAKVFATCLGLFLTHILVLLLNSHPIVTFLSSRHCTI